MLSQKSKNAIAEVLGVSVDVLTSAISSEEEKDIDFDVKKSFNSQEWEDYESAVDREKKGKYDEGKEVGEKQLIKSMKDAVGLDYEGRRSEDFIQKYKDKVIKDANINPDQRVKELTDDIEALKTSSTEKDTEISTLKGQLSGYKIDGKISEHLPGTLPKGLKKEDVLGIIKSNYSFDVDEEGKEVVKQNGEILKDKTRNHISFEQAITDFVTERGWNVAGTGGRGRGNELPSGSVSDPKKIRSMSELRQYFEDNDISDKGSKAMGLIQEAAKSAKEANEEFVYD